MTTAANSVPNPAARRSLAYLPVGAFAMVMGLSGLAIAWRSAGSLWGFGPVVGRSLAVLALLVFAVVGVGYAIKALRHTAQLKAEWTHPVKVAFTATIPVSLLVLAAALQGWLPLLACVLWWVGAVGQFVITLWVVRTWIADAAIQQVHIHPAWFIPAVGNIIAPVAGVELAPAAFNWYFFGVGAVYYVGLLPIVLSRLFTAGTLPPALAPTLAILIAPPSVASLAWVRMGGSWDDPIVKILLGVAVFQTILLLVQALALRSIPFAMSSWAYSFPLAAVTSALIGSTVNGGLRYDWLAMTLLVLTTVAISLIGSTVNGGLRYDWLAMTLLVLTTVAISVLLALTVRAVARGQICRPE